MILCKQSMCILSCDLWKLFSFSECMAEETNPRRFGPKWKIDWLNSVQRRFLTVFQLYHGGQFTYPSFHEALLTSSLLRIIFFPSHRLLSHVNIVETIDSGRSGMNLVVMTIINPRNKYLPTWGSNQRLPKYIGKDSVYIKRSWTVCPNFGAEYFHLGTESP